MDNLENRLEELYRDLGKAYYEGGFENPLPQLLPIFDQITSTKTALEEDSKNTCPNCHSPITEDMMFCGSCGYKLKQKCLTDNYIEDNIATFKLKINEIVVC